MLKKVRKSAKMKMKMTANSHGFACIKNDPTGAIRASFDAKLCCNVNETASALGVSPTTVDSHVRSAVRKLGARNRRHAAALIDRRPSAEMPSG